MSGVKTKTQKARRRKSQSLPTLDLFIKIK
jgi:hypothetical protein